MKNSLWILLIAVLMFALMEFLNGCKPEDPAQPQDSPTTSTTIPLSSTTTTTSIQPATPYPVKGWDPRYHDMIAGWVKQTGIPSVDPTVMPYLCPNYGEPGVDAVYVFPKLIKAIALAESNYDSASMYNEIGITNGSGQQETDGVTGMPIISEGLLQLSYADMKSYPSDKLGCDFDWKADQAGFKDDYRLFAVGRQSIRSSHPERTILRPDINLRCTVHIMDVMIRKSTKSDIRVILGAYWSTMRYTGSSYKNTVLPTFRAEAPGCFE